MEILMIEKEQLGEIAFASEEVLESLNATKNRMSKLKSAMILGNGQHGKVKISFLTKAKKILTVHTTVWAVAEKYINVKANRTIPVNSILSVEI